MKINNIGYLMKEGIRGIFLHGFMSFAAVCVTVACLLIVGGFSCLMYNLSIMVEDLNKTNQVMVYVDENYTDAEARSVGTLINKVDNVFQATFVSREEALEDFVADHGGDSAFVGVDANPLRHRFVVLLEDNSLIEQTVAQLQKVEGVVKISAAYELAQGFTTLQDVLHIASIAVIGVLLLVSLLIISNTVKLAMYDRKDEIAIMKMVGATNGFIRWPFVFEGLLLGLLGAVAAFLLQWLLYAAMCRGISASDTLQLLRIVPFARIWKVVAIVFGATGLLVGVGGSTMAIRRFLKV